MSIRCTASRASLMPSVARSPSSIPDPTNPSGGAAVAEQGGMFDKMKQWGGGGRKGAKGPSRPPGLRLRPVTTSPNTSSPPTTICRKGFANYQCFRHSVQKHTMRQKSQPTFEESAQCGTSATVTPGPPKISNAGISNMPTRWAPLKT